MLELNKNLDVEVEDFQDSKIYYIHDFYKDPDSIKKGLDSIQPDYFKRHQVGSYNGIHFHDMRHDIRASGIPFVTRVLNNLCGQTPYDTQHLLTNCHRFEKTDFNNYEDYYWWPHTDTGYVALIYFNKDDTECGTNLYELIDDTEIEERKETKEHYNPWRPKDRYKLLKTIEPTYNMCVLFDGLIWHGMNICNDRYFEETRINQFVQFGLDTTSKGN
tara:strand:+ start:210 stop:860 length:651 start_codon:yes stop_codon:yes gene_type:complete